MLTALSFSFRCVQSQEQFMSSLSSTLGSLIPLLPLTHSAAAMHWFLRLVCSSARSHDRHVTSALCLSLLVELTKLLSTKVSLNSQLIQTQ